MDQQKITILYCRLSNEDLLDGESNSVQNQWAILTRYAADHGFTNTRVLVPYSCCASCLIAFSSHAIKFMW